jgi:hypothetical protein
LESDGEGYAQCGRRKHRRSDRSWSECVVILGEKRSGPQDSQRRISSIEAVFDDNLNLSRFVKVIFENCDENLNPTVRVFNKPMFDSFIFSILRNER